MLKAELLRDQINSTLCAPKPRRISSLGNMSLSSAVHIEKDVTTTTASRPLSQISKESRQSREELLDILRPRVPIPTHAPVRPTPTRSKNPALPPNVLFHGAASSSSGLGITNEGITTTTSCCSTPGIMLIDMEGSSPFIVPSFTASGDISCSPGSSCSGEVRISCSPGSTFGDLLPSSKNSLCHSC